MSDAKAPTEPSMEEILASIRRIISEDGAPASPPAEDADVLELTQMVEAPPAPPPSESPVMVKPAVAPDPFDDFEAVPAYTPPPAVPTARSSRSEDEDPAELISPETASATSAVLANLTSQIQRSESDAPSSRTPLGAADRTLEDLTKDLLRPLLREWLDQNLPPLVERLVHREIERLVNRG